MFTDINEFEVRRLNNFSAIRLKEIRIMRRFTIEQLAKQVGVTKQSISKYERGLTAPSAVIVEKLIDVLKVPRNYLNKQPRNIEKESLLFFRKAKSTKNSEIDLAQINIYWAYEILLGMQEYNQLLMIDIPEFDEKMSISEKAMFLRNYWRVGINPIDNICELLENHGFSIFTIDSSEVSVDAYSQIIDERPIIIINEQKGSASRWRFDLAHELGHIILHSNSNEVSEKEEKEANQFASAFLLPKESFGKTIIADKLDYFVELKKEWKVSIAAMIYRCKELGILNEIRIHQLQVQLSNKKWRKKEPLDDLLEFEHPSYVSEFIFSNIINSDKMEQFLYSVRLPVENIARLCSLPYEYYREYLNHDIFINKSEYVQLSLFD